MLGDTVKRRLSKPATRHREKQACRSDNALQGGWATCISSTSRDSCWRSVTNPRLHSRRSDAARGGMTPLSGLWFLVRPSAWGFTPGYRLTPVPGYGRSMARAMSQRDGVFQALSNLHFAFCILTSVWLLLPPGEGRGEGALPCLRYPLSTVHHALSTVHHRIHFDFPRCLSKPAAPAIAVAEQIATITDGRVEPCASHGQLS